LSGDEEPLVSILTPVYNGEEHLIECIESALAQTYSRWEYIIVNNHSKDGSEAIARKYAAHDERIRVLSNNSLLPPVTNFNHALRQISPESRYCKMLFADDWLYPRCIEQIVALAEKDHAISIIGSLALEGTRVRWFGLPCDQSIFSGEQVCREHFLQNVYAFGAATACLYRADLVRSREDFFNPLNVHSDMEICFDLLRCSKFGFVHQVLSFSRPRPDSLSSQSTSLGSDYLGMIYHLMKYGRDYLSKQELENCLAQAWSDSTVFWVRIYCCIAITSSGNFTVINYF
jgi:glycosyltransferase involved in cell wall biosynthesis